MGTVTGETHQGIPERASGALVEADSLSILQSGISICWTGASVFDTEPFILGFKHPCQFALGFVLLSIVKVRRYSSGTDTVHSCCQIDCASRLLVSEKYPRSQQTKTDFLRARCLARYIGWLQSIISPGT